MKPSRNNTQPPMTIKNRIQEIEVELINKNENNITPLDFKVNCLKYTYCLLSIFHLNQMKDREHI